MISKIEEALKILNYHLTKGKDVGIFKCKCYDGEEVSYSYDIIIDGDGQNPVEEISDDVFYELYRQKYLLYPACTKVGEHWFYGFTQETKNGLDIFHSLYSCEDYPFLQNKEFYIVPRNKSRVYYVNPQEGKDYKFTKIKEHATVYTLPTLFNSYLYGLNSFVYKSYCHSWADIGWQGARREFIKQNSDYDVEEKDGSVIGKENFCRDFDILTLDGKERFRMNFVFSYEEDNIGSLGSEDTSYREQREKKIRENPNNLFVTFSIGLRGGGMFYLPEAYYKATYLQRSSTTKLIEEIEGNSSK